MSWMTGIANYFARKKTGDEKQRRPIAYFHGKHGGIVVTNDNALELDACFACIRAIAEDMAKMPWGVFGRRESKRIKLSGSNLYRVLNVRPNPDMSAFTFRETMMQHALVWGNGIAEIERDLAGRVVALWPIDPGRIDIKRIDGELIYVVNNYSEASTYLESRDVFHIKGLGDGVSGYSLIGLAAESIGFGIAAEQYGAAYFGNGYHAGTTLKTEHALGDLAYDRIKKVLDEKRGSKNAFSDIILEDGLDFTDPSTSHKDSEYNETVRMITEKMCRWFRVPPHKVGDLSRAHFANIENNNIAYVVDTLMPWAVRLEQEADYKLIGNSSQASYTKISLQSLMRGDSAARADYYEKMWRIGVYSPNMILELEDMDPIGPEGDEHYVQASYTTLKMLGQMKPEETLVTDIAARFIDGTIKAACEIKERYTESEAYTSAAEHYLKNKRSIIEHRFKDISAAYQLDYMALALSLESQLQKVMACIFTGTDFDIKEINSVLLGVLHGNKGKE